MRKKISILIVGLVISGVTLSLVGMTLISQTASAGPNSGNKVPRPIPATDIKVIKKTLPLIDEAIKGKPVSPSGKGKGYSGAATGVLGQLVTGNKYAVVIGICDYPGTDYDICNSDGDSFNMRKALIEKYGYATSDIYWFRDMGGTEYATPTWSNISNAIIEIKGKVTSTDDEVVFFFSGHGARGTAKDEDPEETDEAIVVHNDNSNGLAYIWDGELRNWFRGIATTRVVFVFDSCLAGGMNDVADEGRVVNMATGQTQSAYVYSTGELGEGIFSHYFVNEGMLQDLADGSNALKTMDSNVAVEEAFDYAKAKIPPYLKQRQKPVISDNFTNDLLL